MINRLQVADLKDELISMQMELNNILYETHNAQMTVKTEPGQSQLPLPVQQCNNMPPQQQFNNQQPFNNQHNVPQSSNSSNQQMPSQSHVQVPHQSHQLQSSSQPSNSSNPIQQQPSKNPMHYHQQQPTTTQQQPQSCNNATQQPNYLQMHPASSSIGNRPTTPQQKPQVPQYPLLHQPSQIIKAKQELKLIENMKHEMNVKIEPTDSSCSFQQNMHHNNTNNKNLTSPPPLLMSPTPTKAALKATVPLPGEKIRNTATNLLLSPPQPMVRETSPQMTSPKQMTQHSPTIKQQPPQNQKMGNKKATADDFDIESEITPSFIMKKCETKPNNRTVENAKSRSKKSETDSEINLEYFSSTSSSPCGVTISTNKERNEKHEEYDEWLCIQKELSLGLAKDEKVKEQKTSENHENELSDALVQNLPPPSPKSVEKQLDEIMGAASPLAELFNSPESAPVQSQKSQQLDTQLSVENQLEALFDDSDEETDKEQVDLVETRLERLFQGTVVGNDESALDNASFLYKSSDITYDILQQMQSGTVEPSTPVPTNNKRQWTGANPNPPCEINPFYSAGNSKRPCMAGSSSTTTFNPMDSKWMMDDESAFDFGVDATEHEQEKRQWNGDILNNDLDGNKKILYPGGKLSHIGMEQYQQQMMQQMSSDLLQHHFDAEHHSSQAMISSSISFDDDINQQVQNAIDSILNLQGGESDSLHFSLDQTMGSFLENSPSNVASRPLQQQQQQTMSQIQLQHYQQHQQHHMAQQQQNQVDQLQIGRINTKRKYTTRLDDIGDCLIGGGNSLDDSPSSSLTLSQTPPSVPTDGIPGSQIPVTESSGSSIHGEFGVVNNMIDDPVKSIITS